MLVSGQQNSLELQDYIDKIEKSISPSSEIQNNDKTKVLGIELGTINDSIWFWKNPFHV